MGGKIEVHNHVAAGESELKAEDNDDHSFERNKAKASEVGE